MIDNKDNKNNEPDLFSNDLFSNQPAQRSIPETSPEPPELKSEPETISEPEIPIPTEPVIGPVIKEVAQETPVVEEVIIADGKPSESESTPESEEETKAITEDIPHEDEPATAKTEDPAIVSESDNHTEKTEKNGSLKNLFRKKEEVDDYAYFGILLRDARDAAEMSIENVSRKTKIKKTYLEALEHENFSQLPSKVYIRAYIRTLGELYNMEQAVIDDINKTLQQEEEIQLGEEVYSALVTSSGDDEDDETKNNKRTFPVTVSVMLLIVLIIAGWLIFGKSRNQTGQKPVGAAVIFDEAKLNNFEQDQLIKMSKLTIPE